MSLRDKILSSPKTETIHIDGVGDVTVLRLGVRDIIDLSRLGDQDGGLALLARCILDEHGDPVFKSADEVGALDVRTFKLLSDAAARVNDLDRQIDASAGN